MVTLRESLAAASKQRDDLQVGGGLWTGWRGQRARVHLPAPPACRALTPVWAHGRGTRPLAPQRQLNASEKDLREARAAGDEARRDAAAVRGAQDAQGAARSGMLLPAKLPGWPLRPGARVAQPLRRAA